LTTGLGCFFAMNNVSFIRVKLMLEDKCGERAL
jgi:hypothetical protein